MINTNSLARDQEFPKVTVVIAVYNGRKTIEKSIQSCLDQLYPNIQLIIIDGASTDGTQDILREYDSEIDYWESEPDHGVYHAWNKALKHADGEWICFIGSDDYWSGPQAIQQLVTEGVQSGAELVSGKVAIIDEQHNPKREWGKPWNWQEIKRHHCIAHPGMLHQRSCFIRNGVYSEKYKIAGDYDFSLRLGRNTSSAFVDKALVYMGDGGLSHSMIRKTLTEVREIQANHPDIGPWKAKINYLQSRFIIAVKSALGLL